MQLDEATVRTFHRNWRHDFVLPKKELLQDRCTGRIEKYSRNLECKEKCIGKDRKKNKERKKDTCTEYYPNRKDCLVNRHKPVNRKLYGYIYIALQAS